VLTVALLLVGSLLLVVGAVSACAGRAFTSSDGFADVATSALRDPAVQAGIAGQVVGAFAEQPVASLPAVAATRARDGSCRNRGVSRFQEVSRNGMQETQYHFGSVDEVTCSPARGQADRPVFLVNH
jgi:hypothetical protein